MTNGKREQEDNNKNEKQQEEKKTEPKAEEKELAEVKDRLLRLAAEFDNYKKKAAKDVDNAKGLGKAELVRALLPALDEFELALMAFNSSVEEKSHVKGMELVFSNVLGALKNAGLKEIDSKGKYDPYKHEIIMTKESDQAEGTILEIVRKGYTFNDLMLRPSAVIVSKGRVPENKK